MRCQMTVWRAEDINKRTRDKVRPGDKIIKDGFSYDVIGNHNGLITLKDTDKKRVNYENKRLEDMCKRYEGLL